MFRIRVLRIIGFGIEGRFNIVAAAGISSIA